MNRPRAAPSCDVLIMGGGPAGATVATLLARRGYHCVVLESSRFPRYHIGESLIPNTYGTLDRLGLLPKLRASSFPKKYSVRFVSPSGEESQPFYFFETLPGERAQTWQVDRAEFDAMCLDNARENGAVVRGGCRVREVLFQDGRAVGARVQDVRGGLVEMHSRVVVDASGRSTILGTQLGLRAPVRGLNKAAIWSYYCGAARLDGIDGGETTVFVLPQRGWFWYIPLPDDVVSVGVVADPRYLFVEDADLKRAFLREVDRCQPLSARLTRAERVAPVRGIRRLAYRNARTAGDGWVMVGDAAAFLDPIYSSGLFLALASAELAADCIDDALSSGDCGAARLGAFGRPLSQGIEIIRRLIDAFYDPQFSFREFLDRFPDQKPALIDCLVGDVIGKDRAALMAALATMTTPPTRP